MAIDFPTGALPGSEWYIYDVGGSGAGGAGDGGQTCRIRKEYICSQESEVKETCRAPEEDTCSQGSDGDWLVGAEKSQVQLAFLVCTIIISPPRRELARG